MGPGTVEKLQENPDVMQALKAQTAHLLLCEVQDAVEGQTGIQAWSQLAALP